MDTIYLKNFFILILISIIDETNNFKQVFIILIFKTGYKLDTFRERKSSKLSVNGYLDLSFLSASYKATVSKLLPKINTFPPIVVAWIVADSKKSNLKGFVAL